MAYFNAEMDVDNLKIIITCDTFWSCTCDGNILLSKFSGIGNDEIDLLSDGNTWFYGGTVRFGYGDEHCDYPELQVAYNDYCVINSFPNYILCNGVRTIYFPYETNVDVFQVNLGSAIDRWEVANDGGHQYFVEGNNIIIVANTTNDFVIKPTNCNDSTKYLYIVMVRSE